MQERVDAMDDPPMVVGPVPVGASAIAISEFGGAIIIESTIISPPVKQPKCLGVQVQQYERSFALLANSDINVVRLCAVVRPNANPRPRRRHSCFKHLFPRDDPHGDGAMRSVEKSVDGRALATLPRQAECDLGLAILEHATGDQDTRSG